MLVFMQIPWMHRSISWNKHKGDLCGRVVEWNRSPSTNLLDVPV